MPQNYNYKIQIVEKNRLKGCGISGKRKKPCSPKRTEPEKQDPCGKKNPVVEQKNKKFQKEWILRAQHRSTDRPFCAVLTEETDRCTSKSL